jgi:hypothetical protein
LLVLFLRLSAALRAGGRLFGPPGGSFVSCVGAPTAGGTARARTVLIVAGLALAAALALLLALTGDADAAVAAPHDIIAFPQRDYVSATGYTVGVPATVKVFHAGAVLPASIATDVLPVEDPATPGLGTIDVNHPGGGCWEGQTPDIHAGDTITITQDGVTNSTVVADVTAARPVKTAADTVQIHGTARDDAGNPLPLAQLEHRLVVPRDAFLLNGRRTVRAAGAGGGDGTFSYDAVSNTNPNVTNWTATYSGLDPADVTRALAAESRGMWIGTNESTIYENGAGATPGPAAPCTAPLEKLPPAPGSELVPPTDPTNVTATVTGGNTVALSWTASTDNVGVVDYGIYRDGVEIATVQNADGSAPAPTTFTDPHVPQGTYTYTVDAGDAVGNRSGQSSPGATVTTVRPVATLPAGTQINDPPGAPIQIISFPSRDFISATGYEPTDTVEVQVLRREGGQLVLVSSTNWTPEADPRALPNDPFAGLVEVNHPGGGCWDGVTPDLRAGDIVRTIARNPDGSIRTVDQTRTANVVTQKPVVVQPATGANSDGVIEMHGTAMDADGDPIDPAQVESRLIANRDLFDLNGRRTIRAGGAGKDGTWTYDTTNNPTGVKFTATFSGLDADDVARAVGGRSATSGQTFAGAEARVLWLGLTPADAREITIYENDGATNVVNGPSAPCAAPEEPLDKTPPSFAGTTPLSGAQVAGTVDVRLTWTAATDDVDVFGYRVYKDGNELKNLGANVTTFTDHDTVGTHTYEVDATDSASPGVGGNAQGQPYGNRSAHTNVVTINASDNTAPSVPTGLVAKLDATGKIVGLNWNASTDDVGVASYAVYRRVAGTTTFTKLADVNAPTTSYSDDDPALKAGTKYEYTVDAVDAANNRSAQVAPPAAAIVGTDGVAPTVPTAFSATTPDIHSRDVRVAWTASTDNVGVTGYGVYRRQVDPSQPTQPALVKIADVAAPAGTAVSFTDPKVPAGTYDYTVDAVDSAGNRSAQTATSRVVTANDPPTGTHSIQPFYARDFVSSTGYKLSEGPITVSVIRGGRTIGVSTPIQPVEDPATPGLGAVEVNHPGGGCWGTAAAPNTPNLAPGDVVRFTNKFGVAEQTTVSNVVADRPIVTSTDPAGGGTIVVHGTAVSPTGGQIPVDQLENRLIANRDAFDLNGRRTLRAGGAGTDGTLKYDTATGNAWTATYVVHSEADLARAAGGTSGTGTAFTGAESRAVWLGRDPLALNELTFHENGAGIAGGPAAGITGCTSGPAETPVPAASLNTVGLSFANQGVGSAQSAAQNVVLSNPGGSALTINRVYLAGMNPADYVITSQGCPIAPATLAAGRTCTVGVAFKAKAAGLRQANLSFTDNAANTTDQTVALTATAVDPALVAPGAPVQSLSTPTVLTVAPVTASSRLPVTLTWTPSSTASVTSYQLEQSDNGGAFSPVTVAGGATSASSSIALGTLSAPITHQWRVRACTASACSIWVTGPTVTSAPIDNNTSTSYNGAFSGQNVAGAYGGSVHFSSTANARATTSQAFRIAGNVAWVSTKGPDRGRATVSFDGGAPATVDLYAPTQQKAAVVWVANGLATGVTHTVTVTVLGASNSLSSGSRVDHDAMVYLR